MKLLGKVHEKPTYFMDKKLIVIYLKIIISLKHSVVGLT